MAKSKEVVQQLVIPGVIFSPTVLNPVEKSVYNIYPAIAEYRLQPESMKTYMSEMNPGYYVYSYDNRLPSTTNSGSRVLKAMRKTANFIKDSSGVMCIVEDIVVENSVEKVSFGRGKNKVVVGLMKYEETEIQEPVKTHIDQEVLFYLATNKKIKNKSIIAEDILDMKVKKTRKKKIDYSSNTVIISKKNNIEYTIEDTDVIEPVTSTGKIISRKLSMLDEINEEVENES